MEIMTPHRLENHVAVVTGAGQGLGKAIARRLGQEGARVAVVDTLGDHEKFLSMSLGRPIYRRQTPY